MNSYGGRGVGRFGRLGDAPAGAAMAPGTQLAPMIQAPANQDVIDFFDPQQDGSDIMFYATNVLGLSNTSPNGQSQIQIDSGVDFYWFATTYQADLAGAAQTESGLVIPLVNVLINDTGSRKNLQNIAIPVSSIAGFGERPYRLIRPRLFRASSTVNFTWTCIAANITYTNLFFVMHGYIRPRGT